MIGIVAVLATGYVLGTKAGRERYEQIVSTYKAVTGQASSVPIRVLPATIHMV